MTPHTGRVTCDITVSADGYSAGPNGWWGDDPPFHAPVFVLAHHPREPQRMDGGTTFHFVTDGCPRTGRDRPWSMHGNYSAGGGRL
ncbi:hypothetical protein [Streptomyces poriticola]|uniref:hypothetical protein n=1 Tax=Streptomyces poriticola TaxID=3120506 RepID=UPI002FCE1404